MDRHRQALWDVSHMRTVSCRVPKEASDAFARACSRNRTTRHKVLRDAVWAYIEANDPTTGQHWSGEGPPEARPVADQSKL